MAGQFAPPDWLDRIAAAAAPLPAWSLGALAGIAIAFIDALGPDGVAPFIYFQF